MNIERIIIDELDFGEPLSMETLLESYRAIVDQPQVETLDLSYFEDDFDDLKCPMHADSKRVLVTGGYCQDCGTHYDTAFGYWGLATPMPVLVCSVCVTSQVVECGRCRSKRVSYQTAPTPPA